MAMNTSEQKQMDRIEKLVTDGFLKMNGRVRKLENWRNYTVGAFTTLVFVIGLLAKLKGWV